MILEEDELSCSVDWHIQQITAKIYTKSAFFTCNSVLLYFYINNKLEGVILWFYCTECLLCFAPHRQP